MIVCTILVPLQVGRMNKLLQNFNLAGISLFFEVLGVGCVVLCWNRHVHCACLVIAYKCGCGSGAISVRLGGHLLL